jgi:hypothetical protein
MSTVGGEQVQQLLDEGYVVVRGLLDAERDFHPVRAEYAALLDKLAREWHAAGQLASTFEDLPFAERLIAICRQPGTPPVFKHLAAGLPSTPFAVVTEHTPLFCGAALFGFLTNPRLLDALEAILGSEILLTPRLHMRFKLPSGAAMRHRPYAYMHTVSYLYQDVAWHQDGQTQLPPSDDSKIVTAWIPFTECTVETGTLAVAPRTHRSGLIPFGVDMSAFDSQMVPIEAVPGDVVFMLPRTVHKGLPNRSRSLRWSADLRYMPAHHVRSHDWLPHSLVRTRRHPEALVADAKAWEEAWLAARRELAMRGEPLPGRPDYAEYIAKTFISRWTDAFGPAAAADAPPARGSIPAGVVGGESAPMA